MRRVEAVKSRYDERWVVCSKGKEMSKVHHTSWFGYSHSHYLEILGLAGPLCGAGSQWSLRASAVRSQARTGASAHTML